MASLFLFVACERSASQFDPGSEYLQRIRINESSFFVIQETSAHHIGN